MSNFVLKINPLEKIQTEFGNAKIDNKGYYMITSKKEGNHNKRLHRLIFERVYGPIPEGYVIHHKDEDKLNNCIMNLQLISEFEHKSQHSKGINHKGRNHPRFNTCIKINKLIDERCKQGYRWIAYPYTNRKHKTISSVNLEKCIKKVEDFLKSEINTYGYDSYEVSVPLIGPKKADKIYEWIHGE